MIVKNVLFIFLIGSRLALSADAQKGSEEFTPQMKSAVKELTGKTFFLNRANFSEKCRIKLRTNASEFQLEDAPDDEVPDNFAKLTIAGVGFTAWPDSYYNSKDTQKAWIVLKFDHGKQDRFLEGEILFPTGKLDLEHILSKATPQVGPLSCALSFDPKKKFTNSELQKIKKEEPWIGMSPEALILSIGRPTDVNQTVTDAGVSEQWVYRWGKDRYFYFKNGKLTSFQK